MNNIERENAINELKKICLEIGCSGVDPEMCCNKPHLCDIIRKLCRPSNKSIQADREKRCLVCGGDHGGLQCPETIITSGC